MAPSSTLVRILDFQSGETGSTPVGATKNNQERKNTVGVRKLRRLLQKLAVTVLLKTSNDQLPHYELDKINRKHSDKYRLYEWETIERWRVQMASMTMALSDRDNSLRKPLYDEKLVELLQEYRQQLRSEKKYDVADQLRDILSAAGVTERDDKTK